MELEKLRVRYEEFDDKMYSTWEMLKHMRKDMDFVDREITIGYILTDEILAKEGV